jgi:hypothetical protein
MTVERNTWVNTANQEEQGSFCDRTYGTHVDNVSQAQANDAIESAYYRGDGVVGTGVDTEEHGSDQRYNLTQTDIDGQSFDYPTKLAPGR